MLALIFCPGTRSLDTFCNGVRRRVVCYTDHLKIHALTAATSSASTDGQGVHTCLQCGAVHRDVNAGSPATSSSEDGSSSSSGGGGSSESDDDDDDDDDDDSSATDTHTDSGGISGGSECGPRKGAPHVAQPTRPLKRQRGRAPDQQERGTRHHSKGAHGTNPVLARNQAGGQFGGLDPKRAYPGIPASAQKTAAFLCLTKAGASVLVAQCGCVEDIAMLQQHTLLASYTPAANAKKTCPCRLDYVAHLSSPGIMELEPYQAWMRSFGKTTSHIFGASVVSDTERGEAATSSSKGLARCTLHPTPPLAHVASMVQHTWLHAACRAHFPACPCLDVDTPLATGRPSEGVDKGNRARAASTPALASPVSVLRQLAVPLLHKVPLLPGGCGCAHAGAGAAGGMLSPLSAARTNARAWQLAAASPAGRPPNMAAEAFARGEGTSAHTANQLNEAAASCLATSMNDLDEGGDTRRRDTEESRAANPSADTPDPCAALDFKNDSMAGRLRDLLHDGAPVPSREEMARQTCWDVPPSRSSSPCSCPEPPSTTETAQSVRGGQTPPPTGDGGQQPDGRNADDTTTSRAAIPVVSAMPTPRCVRMAGDRELQIEFLGTGSAEPSKYRASSGIYLDMFDRGGLLLDAGEGTFNQLTKLCGAEEARRRIASLQCLWISHHHADHSSGAAKIMFCHHALVPEAPLLIVGPRSVNLWLEEVCGAHGLAPGRLFTFKHFLEFNQHAQSAQRDAHVPFQPPPVNAPFYHQGSPFPPPRMNMGGGGQHGRWRGHVHGRGRGHVHGHGTGHVHGQLRPPYPQYPGRQDWGGQGHGSQHSRQHEPQITQEQQLLSRLNLAEMRSVPVDHCHDAYGLVLSSRQGWRVVYSADTR